ncbi:translation initiation factor eIF4A [Marasmius crinis-equi]|uniref:Translation initiation factor eIF4A n=1 Tax=Marasmius crinis-equi TaxID=585013 RepID=A0ABR3FJS5_9AGAR
MLDAFGWVLGRCFAFVLDVADVILSALDVVLDVVKRLPSNDEEQLLDVAEIDIKSDWDQVDDTFDNMNLKAELLRGIYAYIFERPSAIQQHAIAPVVKGHDVIAQAQSGTGKAATFSIFTLQQLDMPSSHPRANERIRAAWVTT